MTPYAKLKFSESQLWAMRNLYWKYVDRHMPPPRNYGTAVMWIPNGLPFGGVVSQDTVAADFMLWLDLPEMASAPEWGEFSTLLPFMGQSAIVTKMPGHSAFAPHIDRDRRAIPIYFPIAGCDSFGASIIYDKAAGQARQGYETSGVFQPGRGELREIGRFHIDDNAYVMDVRQLHGVENNKSDTRIAFGWNFKDNTLKYPQVREILGDLGLIA